MTLTVKALLTFLGLDPDKKVTFGKNVIVGIGATIGLFPNLPYTILALQALSDALVAAIAAAVDKGTKAETALRAAEKAWNTAFRKTANYVSTQAAGVETVIVNAGFEASKDVSSAGVLPVLFLRFKLVTSTIKGFFRASVAAIKGVKGIIYVFVSSPAGVTVTQANNTLIVTNAGVSTYIKIGTKGAISFQNIPNAPMSVTAFGVNSKGMGPMTTPLPITPQ